MIRIFCEIHQIIEIYCTISILENYLLFANTIYLRRMKRSFRLYLCHYLSFRPIWYFNITSSKVCNNVMLNTNHSMRHLWEMLYSIDSHSPHIHTRNENLDISDMNIQKIKIIYKYYHSIFQNTHFMSRMNY